MRDILFAAVFPVGSLTDAYFLAFRIPNLLRDLFAEGALSNAFVPTFSEALIRDGKARAFQVGNLILTGAILVTSTITLLAVLFARPITALLSGGFQGEEGALDLATMLARIMMPILILISVSAVFMGMLNAQRRFTAPAYAPALFNVTSIIAGIGLWMAEARGEGGMLIWSLATLTAAVVQAFCQLPSLWRLGFRPRLDATGLWRDPAVRRVLRLMAPAAIGLAAIQINVFTNTYFASRLDPGSLSLLQYAFRLFYLPIGVFGVALAVVTTSRVADEAARGDREALLARTAEGARAVWMLATASSVGLLVLAEPVIMVLFERGMFGADQTWDTVPILQAYMLGVLPYSLVKIYAPGFYSLDRPRIPMVASMVAVVTNVTFNALTYQKLGAPGLALGTTLGAIVNGTILRVSFGRLIGAPVSGSRWRQLFALGLANVVLAGVAGSVWRGGRLLFAPPGKGLEGGLAAVWLALTITAGFLAYAGMLRLLRYPGGEELLRMPTRVLSRLLGRRRR